LIYKFNRKDKIKIKTDLSEWKFKKMDNEYKLQIWDEIKIFLSDDDFKVLNEKPPETIRSDTEQSIDNRFDKNDIVYEDADLIVVNKNSGINVHSWDHKTNESNLIAQIQDHLWDKLNSLTFKPSLIHRVDRDTSGIVLIAKKKDILTKLSADFKVHDKIKKTYYAIVLWKLSRKKGTIKKNLLRIEWAKNENKVQVSESGKTAITHYKSLKEHIIQTEQWVLILTELEVKIETWRMHQIRVHLASIGNPIVWDKTYGDKKLNAYFVNNYWLTRQALHSWKIEFFHYTREKNIELIASIKKDLQEFILKFKK
jgi:RluA family pseudouridine synthase